MVFRGRSFGERQGFWTLDLKKLARQRCWEGLRRRNFFPARSCYLRFLPCLKTGFSSPTRAHIRSCKAHAFELKRAHLRCSLFLIASEDSLTLSSPDAGLECVSRKEAVGDLTVPTFPLQRPINCIVQWGLRPRSQALCLARAQGERKGGSGWIKQEWRRSGGDLGFLGTLLGRVGRV